jgi:PAS domain S-box-containing protein
MIPDLKITSANPTFNPRSLPSGFPDQEPFRLMVESVADYAVFMLDPNGIILTWNTGAERIKGYTADEIIGRHFSVFYPPEAIAARLPDAELAIAAEKGRYEDEGWRLRKDGSRLWANVVITALRDTDGALLGFGKVTRNLTERRKIEQDLIIANDYLDCFRLMVESVQDYAVFMLDPQGIITTWNPGAERINGYLPHEILGKHFSVFYPRSSIEAGLPERELVIAAREGRCVDEGWRLRKDGSQLWASVVITALRDKKGTLVGFGKVTRDLTERRQIEQQLTAANAYLERIRILVEAIEDHALFIVDPEGTVLTWNLGAQRLQGYDAQEIIGRPNFCFYLPEEVGRCAAELAEAATHGRTEIEGWRLRKDGSRFWASVTTTALRDSGGRLFGFGKVIRDLTERRASEAALLESDRVRAEAAASLAAANSYLTNISNASIFTSIIATDLQGTIINFNRGAELMLGYTSEEVVGIHTPALFHVAGEVENRGLLLGRIVNRPVQGFEVFATAIGLQGHAQSEWTYIRKDGHSITVCLSLSTILGKDGQAVGYLGVAQDISRQKQADLELQAAHAQLSSVMDSTSEGIMELGRDWTILYGNRKAVTTLPDFKVGKNYWACFPAVRNSPTEKGLRRTMEERVETAFENYYEPYDLYYRVRIFPTESGIAIFFTDITSEKTLQNQLAIEQVLREKRIEALSHMAGGLAHEISNPLAIIHARASDLKELTDIQTIPPEEIRKACDSIVYTADRAIRILRGLRGLAREAGNDPMEWASIHSIADQCLELQQTRFDRHHVTLTMDLPAAIPLFLCRETQILQILTNLLNNAFDAIDQSESNADPNDRWVILAVSRTAESILIDVTDSGPGIDDKIRPHLMDPFFTTKSPGLGTGVGLSLSRAIAQDHGGTLTLCCDTKNTCFRLVLPINPESANQ